MPFPLTDEQRAVVKNRGGALLVSAAAGSGKTRVLVERLLDRVEHEGLDIDQFLVITFTNAAAAELRARIAQELSARLAQDPGSGHLRRQTTLVYKANICTIDALCIDLLRQHGHLLDVDPDFRICDQAEGEAIALRTLDALLDERYETVEDDPGFAALVEATVTGRDDTRLMNIVLDIHARIQSHPDPARWLAEHRDDFCAQGAADGADTPWGALILAHGRDQAAHWREQLAGLLELAAGDPLVYANYGPTLTATREALSALAKAKCWDEAAACLPIPFPRAGAKRGDTDPAVKAAVTEKRKRCKAAMDALEELLGGDSRTVLADLRAVAPAMQALFDLVQEFSRRFWAEKTRRGLLEFSDGEHLAVKLLEHQQVRALLQERYVEIMVDEYQDTNEVQNVLFEALSRDGKNLFLVGDVKQSIYRFRLADPTIFLDKYRRWPPAHEAGAGEGRKLLLSRNFRSRPQVLHAANDVFSAIMSTRCGELDYGPDEALCPGGNLTGGAEYAAELDVICLPEGGAGEEAVDKNLIEARFVARRMAQLLREGFPVDDGKGGTRPVCPEDMVILLRSPGPVMRHYARALAEAGIPLQSEGDGDFFEATEISVALSLLQVIDNPRQDVPLLSVLRSPVFSFSPDRLASVRAAHPEGDFYAALEHDGGEDCTAFLTQLKLLRFRAGEMSAHRLIERLYDETHLMAIFGAMPGGEKRQANLAALREQARQFEQAGHRGLFGFLTHLGRLRQRGEQPPLPAAGGGVKLLSIHRSKGLEFPVVFLCGLGRQFNKMDAAAPLLFHPRLGVGPKRLERGELWTLEYPTLARQAVALQLDRELKAEEMRLLYVAMTRAREKLIMTMGLTGGPAALARIAPDAAVPLPPETVAAAPSVGRWLLLHALTRPEGEALRAGLEYPPAVRETQSPPWEIRLLDGAEFEPPLQARGEVGRPVPPPPEEQADALAAVLAWRYPHALAADLPSKLTATQLKGRVLDAEAAEDTPTPPPRPRAPFARPDFAAAELGLTAPQRGTALHKVLQYLDFAKTGSAEEIAGEISRLAEQAFLTSQEARSADPRALADFFASDLGRQLLAAPVKEREYKFSLLLPGEEFFPGAQGEQVLFQGVVDCWFEDGDGITVVDFKTDRTPDPERYRPQVEAYARALALLLERPVARKALYFFSTGATFFL